MDLAKRKMHRKHKHQGSDSIDAQTLSYCKRVAETMREGFPSNEEKELFLSNVFKEIAEDSLHMVKFSDGSEIFENLIQEAHSIHVRHLMKTFSGDWENLYMDKHASHVIQRLIDTIPTSLVCDQEKTSDSSKEMELTRRDIMKEFLHFCSVLDNNLDDAISNVYASHIIRSVLQVLGACRVDDEIIGRRMAAKKTDEKQEMPDFPTSPEFETKFLELAEKIFDEETIQVRSIDPVTNPVMQTVLQILHKQENDLCNKYIKRVLRLLYSEAKQSKAKEENIKLPQIVEHEIGSFLFQQILRIGNTNVLDKLHRRLIKKRALEYAMHPVANFVLQTYLVVVKDKEQFEEIFLELCSYLEDILAVNHPVVIIKLAEACHRLGGKQEKLVKSLMEAVHCKEPSERQVRLVPLIATLKTYEVFFKVDEEKSESPSSEEKIHLPSLRKITLHGSLLVQHLLKFGNPQLAVKSILELTPTELLTVIRIPYGSHIIESFFTSGSIGEKSRDLFLQRMKGLFVDIACNKYGSRVIETMWKSCSKPQKLFIAEELSKQDTKLSSDRFGAFIHRNFSIDHFKSRRKDWLDSQGKLQKKRKLFEDILPDTAPLKKKQLKQQKA